MPDPKIITETTTRAKLREQRLFLEVIALRIRPSLEGAAKGLYSKRARTTRPASTPARCPCPFPHGIQKAEATTSYRK